MEDSITCTYCCKKFSAKMQNCPFCGGEHIREIINQIPICPRCNCELENYSYRDNSLDMCPQCSGLWLDSREFKRLTSERDIYTDETIPYDYRRKPLPHEKEYLPCPLCGSLMVRKNFKKISGVLIDICSHHGVWLDAGELEQIRCFIADGGLEEYQDKEILVNKEAIKYIDTRLSDVEFMQKLLHHWNLKRWMFS